MDQLAAIRTFVAIVDGGSQTEAARRLGRSQSAVVRTLGELEKILDVQLILRTTRQSTLTPEGEQYYHDCKRVLSELDAAEERLRDRLSRPEGWIKLTAPVEFGNLVLAPTLMALQSEFDGLHFKVDLTDQPLDLVAGGYDIAVRIGDLDDSGMVARKIGSMPAFICAAPSLIERVGTVCDPRELINLPCVGVDIAKRRSGLMWKFGERDASPYVVRPDPVFVCDSVAMARTACRAGLGFALFFGYQVAADLRDGTLVRVLGTGNPERPIHLLWPPRRPMPRLMRTVLRRIEAGTKSELRWMRNVWKNGF